MPFAIEDKFTGPLFREPFEGEACIERQLAETPPIPENVRQRLVRLLSVDVTPEP